jgi:serine/threonine protein kinase
MSGKGTLMYMAPEILSTRMFNQKADTYSWSMVFYEMLTLSRPFPLRSIDEHRKALVKRKERPPLYNTNIPYPLQHLLQNCWDGDIYQRFRMSEACEHLENLLWECQEGSNALDDAQASIFCTLQDLFGAFLIDFRTGYANTNLAGFDQKNIKKKSCEKEEKDTGTCGTETSRSVGSDKRKENVLNDDKTTKTSEKESKADDANSVNSKCLLYDKAHQVKPTNNPLVKSPTASTPTSSAGLLAPNGKLIYHKFYGPFGAHGRIDYTTMEWLTT